MNQPSPAQLRAYADELRALARTQRGNAHTAGPLLDAATKLTNTDTWSGTYPDQVNTEVSGWSTQLDRAVASMQAEAGRWASAADDFDDKADQLERAAKKAAAKAKPDHH